MVGEKDQIIKLVEGLVARVEQKGYNITLAYLYGSRANGFVHEYSDIDVALISPDFHPESMEEWSALLKICNEVDLRIEPVFYRPEAFVDEEPLAWDIKNNGVIIHLKKAA